jgi:hypothetical protein
MYDGIWWNFTKLTAKVEIVKNERDPALFTGKLLIKLKTFWETLLKLSYDIGFDPMSYDNLSSVSQNILKFEQ